MCEKIVLTSTLVEGKCSLCQEVESTDVNAENQSRSESSSNVEYKKYMARLVSAIKRFMLFIKVNAVGVVNMILLSAVLLVGIEIKDIAEDAYSEASDASTYARRAYSEASDAYSEASDASTYARRAYSEASDASSYASRAYSEASDASSYARRAYSGASDASTYARQAYTQALYCD